MRTLTRTLLVATASLTVACAGPDPARQRGAAEGATMTRAQIEAVVAGPDRSDADRRNDVRRKPVECSRSPACGQG